MGSPRQVAFITFEGIDGCGKTTQLGLLQDALKHAGQETVATHEPGGTALAESIREAILHSATPLTPRAELLLFGAARAQHVEELIKPALEAGQWVLCDRFTDSTVAYQGAGLGLETTFINLLNDFARNEISPDFTFLLDLPIAVGASRLGTVRRDRIESRDDGFHERVRRAFLEIAGSEPGRVVLLDGTQPPAELHRQVLAKLKHLLAITRAVAD